MLDSKPFESGSRPSHLEPLCREPASGPPIRVLQVLARALVNKLRIAEDHLVAELCCGSGDLCRALAHQAALRHPLVAIDALPRPGIARETSSEVRTVVMEPWEFARSTACFDRIFIKDALAGIAGPTSFVAAIRERLTPGGSFTVVQTIPDPRLETELLRSLGGKAGSKLDSTAVADMLRASGYEVRRSHAKVARTITGADYLQLVRSRDLPALSCLSDPQLQSCVDRIRSRYRADEPVEVSHHFDIVNGTRRG